MLKAVLLFALGFALLIKGGDWFVDGASGIAHRFGLPELLIGATVVSIGTTLPEVMVSATSAVSGHGEIAYGNAIGSIICNTALIASLTMAFMPSAIDRRQLKTPVIFFFIAAVFYAYNAYVTGYFSRTTGIILLALFVIYMVVTVRAALKDPSVKPEEQPGASADAQDPEDPAAKKDDPMWKLLLMLVIGAAAIAWGADLLVDNGTIIATELGVPESVIALTFVALGTSLPELITAITAIRKGHNDISVGNVIGANIFNLVLVSGLSITLSPFAVPSSKMIAGHNASLLVDIPVMFLVMLLMTVPALISGKLKRWQGVLLLCIYAAFCIFQFVS